MTRPRRNVRRTLRNAEEQSPMAYRRIDRHPYEYEEPTLRPRTVPLWIWLPAVLAGAVLGWVVGYWIWS